MKSVTRFEAFDGTIFATEAECKKHEEQNCAELLVGLKIDDIEKARKVFDGDAVAGESSHREIAAALEMIGAEIARKRRATGDLKRQRPKGTGAKSPPPSDTKTDGAAGERGQHD